MIDAKEKIMIALSILAFISLGIIIWMGATGRLINKKRSRTMNRKVLSAYDSSSVMQPSTSVSHWCVPRGVKRASNCVEVGLPESNIGQGESHGF